MNAFSQASILIFSKATSIPLRLAFFLAALLATFKLNAQEKCLDPYSSLLRDLEIVSYWNKKNNDLLPIGFNHFLMGGYLNMPSARMGSEGEIGIGYTDVSPYRVWNLRCQLLDRLEISGNYRIFTGVKDPVLSQYGFGEFSDKGVNAKCALWHAEDSDYALPGLAVGIDDFLGTRAFKAQYAVLTQVLLEQNLEISIGYGKQRIKGWFGGFSWMPFRKSEHLLKTLAIVCEYDAIAYKDRKFEPHPKGRYTKTPWNVGFKVRLFDSIDCSFSYLRGSKWSFSLSGFYNLGAESLISLIPKTDSKLPYSAPTNIEPIGFLRSELVLGQDLVYAFRSRGFTLLQAWLSFDACGQKILRLRAMNEIYRLERDVRNQLNGLVANLTPANIEKVIVTIDCEGMPIQEYHYSNIALNAFRENKMGSYELKVLSPLQEASLPNPYTDWLIFKQKRPLFTYDLLPKTLAYFGSATGKFKYSLGIQGVACGYLWNDIYYSLALGYNAFGDITQIRDADRLNPSQLINVRTDIIQYYKQKGITLDEGYVQKVWRLSDCLYGRLAAGYFEVAYGGCLGELLYYPLKSNWAIGLELAALKKRKLNSPFLFTSKIRKLEGFRPTYRKFFGSHCFVNFYYELPMANLDFRVKVGKFLANDIGARFEVCRYFPSGLRISLWYTLTNGRDKINGQTYHDKGVYLSMPLDIFSTRCQRGVWGYGMSAWLRDVGVTAYTGQELYNLINEHRQCR